MKSLLPLFLVACVQDAPLPFVGDCAVYPDGVYEYGQIGIGTCLAGPTDMEFVGDRLLVSNANPWVDFTGGSLLSLDLSAFPRDGRKHLVGEFDPFALPMPSFGGALASAPEHGLALLTNRASTDARTREAEDRLYLVDVSDPGAIALDDARASGGAVTVGFDPNAVTYDSETGIAYVVNRTSHSVTMVDIASAEASVVPPGGPGSVEPDAFVDTDDSGSQAAFVTLDVTDAELVTAHHWDARWAVGTTRVWVPKEGGLYRMTGNGESTWTRSNLDFDLDVDDSKGLVEEVEDPWFFIEDSGFGRMLFADRGDIRAADEPGIFAEWSFETNPILTPSDGWDQALSGPAAIQSAGSWYLYYAGTDGVTGAIGLAMSVDGVTFVRTSDAPLLERDGATLADPFVAWDGQMGRWRMWFTEEGAGGWSIGEAWSDDLLTWVDTGTSWAGTGGAAAPAVSWYGGSFHLFFDRPGLDRSLREAVSVDGTHWVETGAAFAFEGGRQAEPTRVALQVESEGTFSLVDEGGAVFQVPIVPGDTVENDVAGWNVRVAVGGWLDHTDSVVLDAVSGSAALVTVTDDDGLSRIHHASLSGRSWTLGEVALDAGLVGDWAAEGVHDAVWDGGSTLYFAGTVGDVSRIGRAVSDGAGGWIADAEPVLEPVEAWEVGGVVPSSILTEGNDVTLFYSAMDGEQWRVAEAVSAGDGGFTRVAGVVDPWSFEGGALGAWNDSGARDAFVVRDGDIDRMWFAGTSGTAWDLGYAERTVGGEWEEAVDGDGGARRILSSGSGSIGAGGLFRPVQVTEPDGTEVLWYTAFDEGVGRVGRAVLGDPDRAWRDLNWPTLADRWGFTSVPEEEGDSISFDQTVDNAAIAGLGCGAIALDSERGFAYATCKLRPYIYVIDIRDDSDGTFLDLNYLDLETVVLIETSVGDDSGFRSVLVDADRGWLWGLMDEPESAMAIDLSTLVDDADLEFTRDNIAALLSLPRSNERDEGASTQAYVGPGGMAMHPDGRHLFVTNFNDNSVSCFDLELGVPGTLVAEATLVGENPYALRVSPDGSMLVVGNYTGEVEGAATSSTLVLLDADPASATFFEPLGWIGNQ